MTEAKSSLALLPNNEFPPSLEQELARALGKTTPSRSPLAGPGSHAAASGASHGRRGIAAIVLGSETVKVLTHCAIPVLVYREPQAKGFFAAS